MSFSELVKRKVNVVGRTTGKSLVGKHYQSCWFDFLKYNTLFHFRYNELALPIISSSHVTMNMGTGLVHTSYAHGHQDYGLAVERGEEVHSFVDELGRYTRHLGHNLDGKDVLGQGQQEVLKSVLCYNYRHLFRLLKKDFINVGKYIHSYPYDWRTKKVYSIQIIIISRLTAGNYTKQFSMVYRNCSIG